MENNSNSNANATHQHNYEYDIYLSYSGLFTLLNFPSFFSQLLRDKGIQLFHNTSNHEDNNPLFSLRIIGQSRIVIVLISRWYAYSTSCLNELVHILNCFKFKNQLVCPIFYQVDPSDVRNLRHSFGEAMAQHDHNFGVHSDMVKQWKSALYDVSNLSGWHLQTNGECDEHTFAIKIVKWITRSLNKYDVFLSYSGKDTRYSFTGYLYSALHLAGLNTFMDEEGWVNGEQKKSQFHNKAIEESKFSIIVFSNNYAFSLCCLDALVKILECKKLKKHNVFPIFYKVEPSQVRYQTSPEFSKAMALYEDMFGKESERVKKWRLALFEVSTFKGWHFQNGYVYKTIKDIVEMVHKSLPHYDVFLSFRGEDTRYNFSGHLYNVLDRRGLKTFMDDETLEHGEQISEALKYAIQVSRLSIIILSENYAYSSWCLNEVVNIIEWEKEVKVIYYKLKPSDVWHQRKSYGKAMEKHENRLGKGSNQVKKWRSALSQLANFQFWHFETGYEHKFIEKIVENITQMKIGASQHLIHTL